MTSRASAAPAPADQEIDPPFPLDQPARESAVEPALLLGALTLGILWAIEVTNYEDTQWWAAGLLLAGVLAAFGVLRGVPWVSWVVLAHAAAVGVADRVVRVPVVGNDVMLATKEAIDVLSRWDNPYAHTFQSTMPAGDPFGYPPGEILFYAIPNALFGSVGSVDKWMGIGLVVLLAMFAGLVGPVRAALPVALFSTFGFAAYRAIDGSNDTSFSFLLVLSCFLLALSDRSSRWSRALFFASAVGFAWTMTFKQFGVLIYPFVLLYLWRRGANWRGHGAITIGLAALVCLPFAITAPIDFARQVGRVGAHENVWGLNLWAGLRQIAPEFINWIGPAIPVIGIVATIGCALWLARRPALSLGAALGQALMLFFVALFLSNWTTSSYYIGFSVLLCLVLILTPLPSVAFSLSRDRAPTRQSARAATRFNTVPRSGDPATVPPALLTTTAVPRPSLVASVKAARDRWLSHRRVSQQWRHGELAVTTRLSTDAPPGDEVTPSRIARSRTSWESVLQLGALTVGIMWAVDATDYGNTQWWTVAVLLGGVVGVIGVLRGLWFAPWVALGHAVVCGFADRISRTPFQGSDVLPVTKEAIGVLARGDNPYSHLYVSANPPAPFAYLPGEIAFYAIPNAIFGRIDYADTWAGILSVVLLAALAPCVGIGRAALASAVFATFGLGAFRATDGSNDTSLGFLLLLGVVLLAWSERFPGYRRALFYGSALAFAWALLFKQFAYLYYPFLALYLWQRGEHWRAHAAVSLGVPALVLIPFFLTAPGDFIDSTTAGLTYHDNIWGLNVWAGLHDLLPGLAESLSVMSKVLVPLAVIGLGLTMAMRPPRVLGTALAQGLCLLFVSLFFVTWTTSPYYTGQSAILCAAIALVPLSTVASRSAMTPLASGSFARALEPSTVPVVAESTTISPSRSPTIDDREEIPTSSALPRQRPDPTGDHDSEPPPASRPSSRADWQRRVTTWLRSVPATTWLVLTATLVAALLRLTGLTDTPMGLNQDEAVNGYDAWSLIKTGRDHHGHPVPVAGLESFGDWASPLLTFLTAPAVGLFGLKVTVIRAVSGLIGVAAVPIVYRLAVELFGRQSIAIIAAWLIALSPWATHLSRWAIPPTTVPTMVAATLLGLIWTIRRQSNRGIVAVAVLAALTMAGYPTMKLYVPFLGLAAVALYWRTLLRLDKLALVGAGAIAVAIVGPHMYVSTFDPAGRARLEQVSVLRDGFPGFGVMLDQYLSYFSPRFLFTHGDGDAMHLPSGFGIELRTLLPFLLVGVVWLLMSLVRPTGLDRRAALLVLLALVCYPIPGSLTVPSPHVLRAAQLIPLTAIVAAIGVVTAVDGARRLARRAQPANARVALLLVWTVPLALLFGVEVVTRHLDYRQDYGKETSVLFYQGLAPALQYAQANEAMYDEIWVVGVNQPYISVLFANVWSPSNVHENLIARRDPPNFNTVESFAKYRFPAAIMGGPPPDIEAALPQFGLYYWSPNPDGFIAYEARGGEVPGRGRVLVIQRS